MSELSLMIAETAAKVFATASPADGFDAALWSKIEAAGLDCVLLPEYQGGAGEDFEAAVAVARAAGAAAVSVPICETLVASWALAKAGYHGTEGAKALRFDVPTRNWNETRDGAANIAWQPVAAHTIVIAADGLGGCTVQRVTCEGKTTSSIAGEPCMLAEFILLADESRKLSLPTDLPRALYATLIAASLSGAMAAVNAMTFEYANTRKQFGRTLGAFQAIQHMAARMAEEAAASEAAVQVAARALSGPNPLWAAAVAKGRASEAAGKIAASAHQIHGAIGFTREHALHRYTRRLWAWRDRAGSEQHWYAVIGAAALASGRDGLWPGITSGFRL